MLRNLLYVVALFSFGECIVCPAQYTSFNEGCFLMINYLTSSWADSLGLCINTGGYLASINSCSLLEDLVRYFHINDLEASTGYWINATDVDNEGNWTWSDGTKVPMGAPFWGWHSLDGSNWINEPNGGVSENCAMLLTSDRYRFHDENCEKSGSPLCQADPLDLDNFGEADFKGSKDLNEDYDNNEEDYYDMDNDPDDFDNDKVEECPGDFEASSSSCFHFDYNRRVTWNQAYTICRDQYNSHLAILDSCDLFEDVLSLIRNNETYDLATNTFYWLGGSDNNQEGHWYWTNLAPMAMGPPFWGVTGDGERLEPSGNTSQNCANIYKNDQYYFHDTQCELGGYSLCQKDKIRNNSISIGNA